MNTIPHADLIRAVLDGKVVQYRETSSKEWRDMAVCKTAIYALLTASTNISYRVKPEPVTKEQALTALSYMPDNLSDHYRVVRRFIEERS